MSLRTAYATVGLIAVVIALTAGLFWSAMFAVVLAATLYLVWQYLTGSLNDEPLSDDWNPPARDDWRTR